MAEPPSKKLCILSKKKILRDSQRRMAQETSVERQRRMEHDRISTSNSRAQEVSEKRQRRMEEIFSYWPMQLLYFTPREISLHNSIDDLWVTLFGKVLDLTPLIQSRTDDPRTFPLHTFGGKDISHFFNDKGQLKHHVNPDSGKIDFFLPFGSFFDIPSQQVIEDNLLEDETFQNNIANALIDRYRLQRIGYKRFPSQTTSPPMNDDIEPWWEDDKYVIGRVTLKPRWIRVRNTMIMKSVTFEVSAKQDFASIWCFSESL
nr:cytochrome b5 domain-containing protein 1-like [Parasteatoda tepidariorum]